MADNAIDRTSYTARNVNEGVLSGRTLTDGGDESDEFEDVHEGGNSVSGHCLIYLQCWDLY